MTSLLQNAAIAIRQLQLLTKLTADTVNSAHRR